MAKQHNNPIYEAEIIQGLEDIARHEIESRLANQVHIIATNTGAIQFRYTGPFETILTLKTVIAIYSVLAHPIPRPKALLGHQHLHAMLKQIASVRQHWPQHTFNNFYISAAGSNSSVMRRIKDELAAHTGLDQAHDEGDLLIRIRRTHDRKGWETLVRLTSRPLATRQWRVEDMAGALNASAAQAMTLMAHPQPDAIVLNIACGSGTLLIEGAEQFQAKKWLGCDIDAAALHITQINLRAANLQQPIHLIQCDAQQLPMPDQYVDTMLADLPFGQLVGSHETNLNLYPALLKEAARVAKDEATFFIVTHEVNLMENTLHHQNHWEIKEIRKITLSGIHPRIFVLKRVCRN